MLSKLHLDHILFLDIETVPQHAHYNALDAGTQELWEQKTRYQRKEGQSAEAFYDRAGIWAEFGKIICISVGHFQMLEHRRKFRVSTFYGEEFALLKAFKKMVERHFGSPKHLLCAHNGKEFDFPYIARRMVIHGIPLPHALELFGKKPWEVAHLDTLELWKFGDYKHYTSLKLLAHVLDIPSPKVDLDGSMVRDVYYGENNIKRIVDYCELDVITTAQVLLRLRYEALLDEGEVERVTP
ncbi:3'-5' exonuclease [Maribacter sp. 2307ULW6-5]|uniref:3'-5' exonuclease n=1 Tax=Maribacter sp. 2307ULW6-5 TaxID=3386275 RepID=UPI0039BD1D12